MLPERQLLSLAVVFGVAVAACGASPSVGEESRASQKLRWLADKFVENQTSSGMIGPAWDSAPRGFVHGFISIEMGKAFAATGNQAYKTAADNYFTYYLGRVADATTTPANHGIMLYGWGNFKRYNPQSTEYDQRMDAVYGYMTGYRWNEGSYFQNGYDSTDGMDAANTCDLASMGSGLLSYYGITKNSAAYQAAKGIARYFVAECAPLTYQGAWSSPLGTWVVAPTANTTFEHHPASADTVAWELGWGFGAQEAADFLIPFYSVTTDEVLKGQIKEKLVTSMKWQFDQCQFEDGALGLFGRDDKWMGMTAAAVQTYLWNLDAGFLSRQEILEYQPHALAAANWMLDHLDDDCLNRAGYYQVNGPATQDHRSNGYWGISWAMEPLIRYDELISIPEPSTVVLLAAGLFGLLAYTRFRGKT